MSHRYLLVGIDTESDNQWDADLRLNPTFQNILALPRLHAIFQKYGVRPTYLVTHPVVTAPEPAGVIRALAALGDCEIGAHHHAWETPPCTPDDARRHPYASALPIDQFEQQLERLTDAIEAAVGQRPTAYRSGRFGFSASHVSGLERLGYRVESSVTPLFFEAHKGGPDFSRAPLRPYYLAYDDSCTPGSSNVLEVPVTAALDRRVPHWVGRRYARLPKPYTAKRILRRLGIAKVVWLRPSYSSLDEMVALARRLDEAGEPVLNVLFHSSEAIVGGSPYNRTQPELDAFLDRLDSFLAFATEELEAMPVTFGEFRSRWCVPDRRAPARRDRIGARAAAREPAAASRAQD